MITQRQIEAAEDAMGQKPLPELVKAALQAADRVRYINLYARGIEAQK